MTPALNRIILYVQDVEGLRAFYTRLFGLPCREHIPGEWAVLQAGACELALHRVGEAYRVDLPAPDWRVETNCKLVFTLDVPLAPYRDRLLAEGYELGEIKTYPGLAGPLCDGRDPEGNVFQIAGLP